MKRRSLVPLSLLAAILLYGGVTTATQVDPASVDTSDFSTAVESTSGAFNERGSEFHIGTDTQGLAVYVYVDATGLAAQTLTRIQNAMACDLNAATATMLDRFACKINQTSLFGWKKASATNEYIAYVVVDRDTYLKLKWLASTNPRITVFSATWATVKASPKCASFFPPYSVGTSGTVTPCSLNFPPAVYYGVGQ